MKLEKEQKMFREAEGNIEMIKLIIKKLSNRKTR